MCTECIKNIVFTQTLSVGHMGWSTFWPLWTVLLWIFTDKYQFELVFNSFGFIFRSGIAGLYCNCLTFWKTVILLSTVGIPFHIPTNNVQRFNFSISLPTLIFSSLVTAILTGAQWHLIVVLMCTCFMTNTVETLHVFIGIHIHLWRSVYSRLLPNF